MVGRGVPRVAYLDVKGNQLNYFNGCFAENEEAISPGRKPLSVSKDYNPNENIVKLFVGHSFIGYGSIRPYLISEIMRHVLLSLDARQFGTTYTFFLSPLTAKDFVRNKGFDTKEKLNRWLVENTFFAMWNYWLGMPDILKAAKSGIEPFASLLRLPPEALSQLPLIPKSNPVDIMIAGEEMEQFWKLGNLRCIRGLSIDKCRQGDSLTKAGSRNTPCFSDKGV